MYFITHPDCLLHDVGLWHPERPARLTHLEDHLIASQRMHLLTRVDAPAATHTELLRVHSPAYLARLCRLAASATPNAPSVIDSDTMVTPHTLRAAARAAGAVRLAVELVLSRERLPGGERPLGTPLRADRAFCAVRPPGHHASRDQAMGFCFYNNVAVGVAHAAMQHGIRRTAIVDFDVHHGNGTESILTRSADQETLFVSLFQHPFYPPVPETTPPPGVHHVRLPAGTGSGAFRSAVTQHVAPPLAAFHPELLFISAGFDGHAADPYADWHLHEDDFAFITESLLDATTCPVVSVLEGGYDLPALGRCAAAHIDALLR
ncbi:MAG: deacetylase [Bacteroidetes bacterium CG12_big_fil_rev_8_21_14_0_65_60_17]|nr:MAG: deacetylase [Bacteroidetes bacterium CG12_big_fil_rev_8_21_14_0_65_60_17]